MTHRKLTDAASFTQTQSHDGVLITGKLQNSAPHDTVALQGPPLHPVSCSAEQFRYLVHPTPQVEHPVQFPAESPPHPLLYCPAAQAGHGTHAPSRPPPQDPR